MAHLKELEASAKRLEPSGAMLKHLKQLVAAKIESNEAMAKHVKQLQALAQRLKPSESIIQQIEIIVNEFFP